MTRIRQICADFYLYLSASALPKSLLFASVFHIKESQHLPMQSLFMNINLNPNLNPVKQIQHIGILHPNTAVRSRPAVH